MSSEEGEKKVRIIDRRRFDSAGEERQDPVDSEADAAKERGQQLKGQSEEESVDKGSGNRENEGLFLGEAEESEGQVTFSSFVLSLATQALMQMGQMQPPPGVEVPKDKAAAKQTIELLAMLQVKTRGNLDPQEDSLLDEILHNLRLGYVKAT